MQMAFLHLKTAKLTSEQVSAKVKVRIMMEASKKIEIELSIPLFLSRRVRLSYYHWARQLYIHFHRVRLNQK